MVSATLSDYIPSLRKPLPLRQQELAIGHSSGWGRLWGAVVRCACLLCFLLLLAPLATKPPKGWGTTQLLGSLFFSVPLSLFSSSQPERHLLGSVPVVLL